MSVSIQLNKSQLKDLYNLSNQVYHPLTGFLKRKDFLSVVQNMRLSNNEIWPIPIVLDISSSLRKKINENKPSHINLVDKNGAIVAHLSNYEIYNYDKHQCVENVYGTRSVEHPGVAEIFEMDDFLIGGDIKLTTNKTLPIYPEYNLTPSQTKKVFENKGWKTIAAFQTRNVPHRGHEFIQKKALQIVDGLMIQPVIGQKKLSDFKDEFIIGAYEALINKYYPLNKVVLTILPIKMRYAGPREAVMHALIRRNFGCTHFIVGRDHAGVGGFYKPFAAQEIFEQFNQNELKIKIIKFEEVVYDTGIKKHNFASDAKKEDREYFSGSKIREYIANKKDVPGHLMRQEVLSLLHNSHNSFVDETYMNNIKNNKAGFVLWLTGLSGSGKSTIADKIHELLLKDGYNIERLDGDVVRDSLTKDLGFSKEDRDENIKRVGFVANLLSKNGVGVIASFITPYKDQRQRLRDTVHNYIEVFISTPLKVCEKRDVKGLYQKARAGKIKNFTGIDDPYEEPEDPELEIAALEEDPTPYAEQIIEYLKRNEFI